MTLVELLKLAQGNRGLNAYASHAGVDAGNLSRIMKGQIPSPRILRRLANKAQNGVTYEQLLAAANYDVNKISEPQVLESLIQYVPTEDFFVVPVVKGVRLENKGVHFDQVLKRLMLSADSVSSFAFFLVVEEESMSPYIKPGDLALVRTDLIPANGDLALVISPGQEQGACIRRLVKQGSKVILHAFNPACFPQLIKAVDLKIVGQVVETRQIW